MAYSVILLCLTAISMARPLDKPKSAIAGLQATYMHNLDAQLTDQHVCTKDDISVRKSWSALTLEERTSYLEAVKCLHSSPSTSDKSLVPGARNRLDDFTYSHINQTNFIQESGLLLPWHRQFIWAYEQALRDECGYKGSQPYWDWSEYAEDQSKSPVFDGTPTSFGGNGKPVPHSAQNASMPGLPSPFLTARPAGTGGGCIKDGGLGKDFTAHLGPVYPARNPPDNLYGTQYNPRCLKRDFLPALSSANLTYRDLLQLLQTETIHDFRPRLEASMHPIAHSTIGGNIFDLYSSPSDPVFYLLHGQIDRLWTIWQGQDFEKRTNGLDGTVTFLNDPPSHDATLDTMMKMGTAGDLVQIRDAMSTYKGQYCYMYV